MTKERKKRLGQFFTPPAIVEFMLELVGFDPMWKVIDPACGEGIFLLKCLERGCGAVAGVDIDPEAIERARELLKGFEGRFKLFLQDGLMPIEDDNAFWRGNYDLVIGNPPFSFSKWRIQDPRVLDRFELSKETVRVEEVGTLFKITVERRRKKTSVPIEVLFLERFAQLCRPGGKVCIILPVGVLNNEKLRYVREWLLKNFTVHGVISLPKNAFKGTGTSAVTSVLYFTKSPPPKNHEILFADLEQLDISPEALLGDNPTLKAIGKALRERFEEISKRHQAQ